MECDFNTSKVWFQIWEGTRRFENEWETYWAKREFEVGVLDILRRLDKKPWVKIDYEGYRLICEDERFRQEENPNLLKPVFRNGFAGKYYLLNLPKLGWIIPI